jgi:hypothetical protein
LGSGPARRGSREWWRTSRSANQRYREVFGRRPNLLLARRHSERLQRAKLFQRDPRMPVLADKIEVKRFIAERVGEQYVVPTLFAGTALPPRADRTWPRPFFVKASHGHGQQKRVEEPSPRWRPVERAVERWLGSSYGDRGGEWHYSQIPRRILVEPHVGDPSGYPDDYKLWVFHGRVHLVNWMTGRGTAGYGGQYLDRDWKTAFRSLKYLTVEPAPPPPSCLDEMIRIAETLGRDFTFVRVDCYEIEGRPLVGELTFTPTAGYNPLDPADADLELGRLWRKPGRWRRRPSPAVGGLV